MPTVSPIVASPPRLLAVGESKRSGLILCKSHYAEFAGPGAAIACSAEQGYISALALGSPEIVEVITHEERQKAYSRRIQWVRWLNKIVTHPEPIQRTEKLFTGFREFFGEEILAEIPDEIMALLAGVLPQTVTSLRLQDPHYSPPAQIKGGKGSNMIKFLDWRTFQPAIANPAISIHSNFSDSRTALPYSA
jgi:hypothetical protein